MEFNGEILIASGKEICDITPQDAMLHPNTRYINGTFIMLRIHNKKIEDIYECIKHEKINKTGVVKITKLEINLKERYSKKLGVGSTAKKLFQEINNEPSVILNFKNIEFMSRSFAQEYVFQKHNSETQIEEINMNESIQRLFEIIEEDFNETCLNS